MNIQNVWAVGQNYADHAKELGSEPPKEPLYFLKAGSCVLPSGQKILLPPWSLDVHHEVELAVQLGENLRPWKGAIAIDLTARDLQTKAKNQGLPWTLAKSFKGALPLGNFFDLQDPRELDNLELLATVNGQCHQKGNTRDMIFDVPKLLSVLIERFPVLPGDLLLTGTPAGVSALRSGDILMAEIPGRSQGQWSVL